jgi:autotransporter passenger strand-loop-strand repeat protein
LVSAAGELLVNSGATVSTATISGVAFVGSGGVAIALELGAGGQELDQGHTTGTTVLSGGEEDILAIAQASVVGAGGTEAVLGGGNANQTTIQSGGRQIVSLGGTGFGDTILSGGVVDIRRFANAIVTTVMAGGVLNLSGFGTLNTLSGGLEIVASGAVDGNGHGKASGSLLVSAGGSALFETVAGAGAAMTLLSGAVSTGSFFNLGGQENVSHGARDVGASIQAGGLALVAGVSVSAHVSSGGIMRISHGGVASAAQVSGSGTETILATASAKATVLSGGTEFDYGQASGTTVLSGGHERVFNHAVASASVISSGGFEAVSSGGVAVAAKVSGGVLVVSAGGAISGGVTIADGKAVVSGAAATGQAVKFTGSAGVLELANLAGFQAKISGLAFAGQKIDLDGFQFGAGETLTWTQNGASGTLAVHDGAETANLTLIGTYATSDFAMNADGKGGTIVKVTGAGGMAAPRFVEAMARLPSGRSGAIVIQGGASVTHLLPLTPAVTSGR